MPDFRTEPVSSIKEMTYYLANDLKRNPEDVVGWVMSIAVKIPDSDNMYHIVNRFSDDPVEPVMLLTQIECMIRTALGHG